MFYKSGYLNEEIKNKFRNENVSEFIYALYQKLKIFSHQYELGYLVDKDEPDFKIPVIGKKTISNASHQKVEACLNIDGLSTLSYLSKVQKYQSKRRNFEYQSTDENEFLSSHADSMSPDALLEAQSLVSDFHNFQKEVFLKDKSGEDYRLIIIENADASISDNVIIDKGVLFNKDNHQIGYVSTKYTTLDIQKKLMTSISKTKGYFHLSQNQGVDQHYFLNVASIDYSNIQEDYQNKGLGTKVYFEMAKHLNKKGLEFRGSSLQSNDAKGLWSSLKKTYPENIIEKDYNGQKFMFFQTTAYQRKYKFLPDYFYTTISKKDKDKIFEDGFRTSGILNPLRLWHDAKSVKHEETPLDKILIKIKASKLDQRLIEIEDVEVNYYGPISPKAVFPIEEKMRNIKENKESQNKKKKLNFK
jgi:hypothetical protein